MINAPWLICHVNTAVVEHVWEKATDKGIKILQILLQLSLNIFRKKLYKIYMDLPREVCLWMEKAFWNMISRYTKRLHLEGSRILYLILSLSGYISDFIKVFLWLTDFLVTAFEKCIYICSSVQLLTSPFLFPTVLCKLAIEFIRYFRANGSGFVIANTAQN